MFIILSAFYGVAVNEEEEYSCENPPPDGLTYEETISLVYKVIPRSMSANGPVYICLLLYCDSTLLRLFWRQPRGYRSQPHGGQERTPKEISEGLCSSLQRFTCLVFIRDSSLRCRPLGPFRHFDFQYYGYFRQHGEVCYHFMRGMASNLRSVLILWACCSFLEHLWFLLVSRI